MMRNNPISIGLALSWALVGLLPLAVFAAKATFNIDLTVRPAARITISPWTDTRALEKKLGPLRDLRISAAEVRLPADDEHPALVRLDAGTITVHGADSQVATAKLFAVAMESPDPWQHGFVVGGYIPTASQRAPGVYRGTVTVHILFQ